MVHSAEIICLVCVLSAFVNWIGLHLMLDIERECLNASVALSLVVMCGIITSGAVYSIYTQKGRASWGTSLFNTYAFRSFINLAWRYSAKTLFLHFNFLFLLFSSLKEYVSSHYVGNQCYSCQSSGPYHRWVMLSQWSQHKPFHVTDFFLIVLCHFNLYIFISEININKNVI